MGCKVMVIGLDGVSFKILKNLVEQNKLELISKFFRTGVYGILKSTIPCNTCPALPSLYTGKNAGNLGIFDFIKPNGSIVTYNDYCKHNTIWNILSKYNYRSILFGARMIEPIKSVKNCYLIPDDSFSIKDRYKTYPAHLKNILEQENYFLNYDELDKLKKVKDCNKIYKLLLDNLENRINIFYKLITKSNFDFSFLWIGHTDIIQHQCWNNKEIIYKFLEDIDNFLQFILNESKFYDVFIISDHGFGTAPEYNFHLNEWLYREGYLKMKYGLVGRFFYTIGYRFAELLIPDYIKKKILYILHKKSKRKSKITENDLVITPLNNIPGVDWSKTIAHVTTDKCWGIRIIKENLDRDYEDIRNEIIQKLKQITFNGIKVIKDAWKGEEIYWGKYKDQIPDIIFLKEDIFRIRPSLVGSMFTKIKRKYGNYVGDHESARDGIFIAYGKDIKDTGEFIGKVQIYDIAPTILHMYNIPIPMDIDGRVLKEIFKENSEPYIREIKYSKNSREKDLLSRKIKELKELKKLKL